MNENLKRCNEGHFYNIVSFQECPHCLSKQIDSSNLFNKNESINKPNRTVLLPNLDLPSTELYRENYENKDCSKNSIENDNDIKLVTKNEDTVNNINSKVDNQLNSSFDVKSNSESRTDDNLIVNNYSINHQNIERNESYYFHEKRKIVGWLISYSINSLGVDFKLYEGSNSIGRSNNNTIVLSHDSLVSDRHLSILFRKDKYWIRDEMSATGTILNNVDIDLDKIYEMHDGDILQVGSTIFKFKSSF